MKSRLAFAHPSANSGKLAGLEALQVVYRAYTQACIDQMITAKRHHVPLKERQTFFLPSDVLSSQLQKCARMQAVNTVSTWHASLWCRLKRRLYGEKHPDTFRTEVRLVALYGLTEPKKCGHLNISREAIDLWWSWVWNTDIAGRTPVLRDNTPMWLSEMTIEVEPPRPGRGKGTEAKLAKRWARVSCLMNGRRIAIPLVCDPKILTAAKLAKTVLVGKRNGRWAFQFTDEVLDPTFDVTGDRIAVDVGKNVLAATSEGQLLDSKTSKTFDRIWNKFHDHRRNRQRLGKHLEALGRVDEAKVLLAHSDRLRRKEQAMTGLIKTAAGNVAHRLVEAHPGVTFVMEDLDLRRCKGRKRFQYRAVQRAIETRAPTIKVNPAYTSQTCNRCGYTSRLNRAGTKFRCLGCGHISHADVNAGVNLLGRSEDKQVTTETHFTKVRVIVRDRYRQRRDRSARLANKAATVPPAGQLDGGPLCSGKCDPLMKRD
jgi:hypothetical protein